MEHRVETGMPGSAPVTAASGPARSELKKPGENLAADLALIHQPADPGISRRILLVRRRDDGTWALPGGRVDAGEDAPTAMCRELLEEAGIDVRVYREPLTILVEGLRVDDPRNTPQRWMATTLGVMVIDDLPRPVAGSDAADASWVPFPTDGDDPVERLVTLLGEVYQPHPLLLALVAKELVLLDRIGGYFDVSIGPDLLSTGVPSGEVRRQRRRYVRDARRSPAAVAAIIGG